MIGEHGESLVFQPFRVYSIKNDWRGEKRNGKDLHSGTESEIVKKAEETSVLATSKEFGVSRAAITAWKKAAELEATTKKVRGKAKAAKAELKEAAQDIALDAAIKVEEVKAGAKKTRGKAKAAKAELKEAAQDVALDAAIKVEDKALIEGIEAKKKVRATGRKAKDTAGDVKEKAKAATKSKSRAIKASYILQSAFGHELIVDEIQAKIPDDVEKVYIRIDQNKLHFIRKDGSTGSVDIWE